MKVRVQVLISVLAAIPASMAWMAVSPPRSTQLLLKRQQHPFQQSRLQHVRLHQSDSSENSQSDLERQRQTAQEVVNQISDLKKVLLEDPEGLDQTQIDDLEAQVLKMESELVPPSGLTMQEFQATMVLFLQLPFPIRSAFCEALELDNPGQAASDLKRIPEIVTLLYQQRIQLTPQRLQDGLKEAQKKLNSIKSNQNAIVVSDGSGSSSSSETSFLDGFMDGFNNAKNDNKKDNNKNEKGDANSMLRGLLFDDDAANKSDDELQRENTVKSILGRVTRKEGIEATQADLDRILKVLDKETFVVSTTESIPGGFIIRGKQANTKQTGAELIAAIDQKLPQDFPSQVAFMEDPSTADVVGSEMVGDKADPVLVLLNKDFTPEASAILTTLSTTIAIMAAFVFCVSVYGQNDLVASRLSEATAVNDADGISWFTGKVYDVLVPILAIQALHETGHFAISKARNFEMAAPTFLPFYGLPFMGTKTDLTESPPNRNALFDFAIMGPLLALVASFGCFTYGLELTATADAATAQFFPALPVDLIQKSTLGGSMIDYFLGGGMVGYENRFVTMQDGTVPVPLHPLAIAGFTSLVMNAIALLPLGSTDGGRLSQAIFGRYGHLSISSFVWFALLITTFTVQRSDIIIGAWAINNIIQNDCEIPCRDETEDVGLPRIMAAISLWFVTILALTPL